MIPRGLLVFAVCVWGSSIAHADRKPTLPSGHTGIAAKYPADQGIERDSDVVFVESFEADSFDVVARRWDSVRNQHKNLSLDTDVPPNGVGKNSLRITHVGGKGTGGHLYRRLQPGYERLFARFYVKFDRDCAPIHHFGTNIGGNNPATRWPVVNAGSAPPGNKSFWTGIEPHSRRWVWDYYTYWGDMRGSPPRGQKWGNSLIRDPHLKVEKGRWICVEVMVKLNDPGDTNGEMALWIDGSLVSHLGKGFPTGTWTYDKFTPGNKRPGIRWSDSAGKGVRIEGGSPFEGFRWRTAKELKINYVWPYV